MNGVRLVICDSKREIQATRHGAFAQRVIAALSAEPETIEELDAALERFGGDGKTHFRGFSPAGDDRPDDGGLVVVDLSARMVVYDSTDPAAIPEGVVTYRDPAGAAEVRVRYSLSDDWLLKRDATDWRQTAEKRRRRRRLEPTLDARSVLYGEPLLQFIAEECFKAFSERGASATTESGDPGSGAQHDLVREIHARWLMTPRDDLRGRTPRQVMVAQQRFVDADLRNRADQWSWTGRCPQGLDPDSAAYRFAGFGTHEIVVYYDLVRELLRRCKNDAAKQRKGSDLSGPSPPTFVAAEVPRLARLRDRWLDSPDRDSDHRTPRSIIRNERARIPEGEEGRAATIDCDCPLCEMLAESSGPVFWHLDGSHMDDDFAFSLWHETYEEWEEEQRDREKFFRRLEMDGAETRNSETQHSGACLEPDAIWKASSSKPLGPEAPVELRLFAIGAHLCELIVDLNEPPGGASSGQSRKPGKATDLVDRLNAAFRKLRQALAASASTTAPALIPSALADLTRTLDEVADARPDLGLKCADLRDRLARFLNTPWGSVEPDLLDKNDLPC